MNARAPRLALSLLELILVIAVIAVMMAMVLPAIQKVRAAAARTKCLNNLKQIGLALQGYHEANGHFPPGMSLKANRGAFPFLSWNAHLLQYLEEDALWREIQAAYAKNRNFLAVPPHIHRKTVVRAFACPADPRSGSAMVLLGGQEVAFTSYLGVEGADLSRLDGILFMDSAVRCNDITDGLSHTLLVGERPPSKDGRYGWWYAGWGQNQSGSAEMVLGVREQLAEPEPCPAGPYHFRPGSNAGDCDFLHFWSHHPGGAHFLLADGSARLFSYSADAILPALALRAGGEPVTMND